MLADAALQSEDFERAAEMTEGMVSLLGKAKAPQSFSPHFVAERCGILAKCDQRNARAVPTQDALVSEAGRSMLAQLLSTWEATRISRYQEEAPFVRTCAATVSTREHAGYSRRVATVRVRMY